MASGTSVDHRSGAGRRIGYYVAMAVDAALLYVINGRPGWEAMPFLTEDAHRVVGLVNLSLAAGLVCNVVYVFRDAAWLKALGDLTTTVIAFAVVVRLLQVFPFDVRIASVDWVFWGRFTLVLIAVATAVAVIVQFVTLVRAVVRACSPGR